MNRVVVFVALALVLAPLAAFAAGEKEAPEAVAPVAEVELGSVINRSFELINPRTGERGKTVVIDRFKASPMWREKVEAGELPPVDERVPEEPLVLQPIESIGKYGGSMRMLRLPEHLNTFSQRLMLEHLVTWTYPYFEELNPNVAKGWTVSPDATTITFYLREGMKWSDGQPFTADAIVWWFEHIIKNDDLHPSKPGFLLTRGNLPAVTKIDNTTVRFAFTDPNPTFLENAARIRPMPYAPGHYLEQFHPDFVSRAEVDRLAREGEYDTWMAMFNDKRNFYGNPDIPSISGWLPLNHQSEEVARFERNPYYWKVDSAGNQLPYIDGMDHAFVMTRETWLLQALAGELTYATSEILGWVNLPLMLENQERGGYQIAYMWWPPNNQCVVQFNFGHADPVKRQLIDDRRFRLALLKAIDHDEVNEVIYEGAMPPSWPQSSDHLGIDHELYYRYIGRDLNEANRLLDEIGLTARDGEGFRLGPDRNRLILISLSDTGRPVESAEVQELYRRYWQEIGIRVVNRVQSGALAAQMRLAGEYDLWVGNTAPGGRPLNIFHRGTLMPISPTWGLAPNWATWIMTDGREGVEPPDWVKRLRQLQVEGMTEPSDEKRDAYIEEALEIWVENLVLLPGYSEPRLGQFFAFQKNLRNFAAEISPEGHRVMGTEHHITPSQTYYFE